MITKSIKRPAADLGGQQLPLQQRETHTV